METLQLQTILKDNYGLEGELKLLNGFEDLNYRLNGADGRYVVKVVSGKEKQGLITAQNALLEHLSQSDDGHKFPRLVKTQSHKAEVLLDSDNSRMVRVLSYLDGEVYAEALQSLEQIANLGQVLGKLDNALMEISAVNLDRGDYEWDLKNSADSAKHLKHITDSHRRSLAEYFFQQYNWIVAPALPKLRKSIIHSDANDYNILTDGDKISGLIDFGDAAYSQTINEVAIALAYVLTNQDDLMKASIALVAAYHEQLPLEDLELELLYYLIAARLCVTVCRAAYSRSTNPENAYLLVSEEPAWNLLERWIALNPIHFQNQLQTACGRSTSPPDLELDLANRNKHLAPSLSISYDEPIKMSKAAFQYMHDAEGRTYLDCVNNICHVGHCHPRVVEAGQRQMAALNTNTRYIYDQLNEYAELLSEKLPPGLDTIFFMNSGSEAGDLAQRIARTVTGNHDTLVFEHGYHGNTIAGIEVSHYKYNRQGGPGKVDHIHEAKMPDIFRDGNKEVDEYMRDVANILDGLDSSGRAPAAFYAESLLGCGGQIELPAGFLEQIYHLVRATGGLCIADEVQVGFGRVGSHFWGFETQEVVPDIVVMGKPMGNGHPIAAVATTKEIAAAFDTGMEFFSSFGGNPVSCEIGKAVLKVIDEENMQESALANGNYLKERLQNLATDFECIGDVRGRGLFIGIELVKDRVSLGAAPEAAKSLVNFARKRRVLLSTDGPMNNVIKIKPPMRFNQSNADQVIATVREGLSRHQLS